MPHDRAYWIRRINQGNPGRSLSIVVLIEVEKSFLNCIQLTLVVVTHTSLPVSSDYPMCLVNDNTVVNLPKRRFEGVNRR